ncbi:MAG: hypothetical protein CFH01_01574 [Alphaproteobacteria bacterium MarineAlpha2_Bin1]|nr:MAG: hypothetical protein CFH01_01574 [Alphaproteobacteria bacterium MarineAlpha2_Bin1]|tara:strand:- start:57 stop:566 length:510 start_codon:yes stop_codon:yes gene_type:complete
MLSNIKKLVFLSQNIILISVFIILYSPNILANNQIIPPYFGSIKWNKANVRTGPGQQYPIEWEFHKKNLPIEIISKYENWLKIRFLDQDVGWVHQRLVSKSRYVMISGSTQILRDKPDNISKAILIVEDKVLGRLISCNEDWCKISIKQKNGWILKHYLWGVYPDEILD